MSFEALAEQAKAVQFKHGDVCHVELPFHDLDRAKTFYGEVFGWQFHDVPGMDYTLFLTPGGQLGGGLFKPSPEAPEKVVNYMNVDSIEETAEKLVGLGGQTVSPKIEIPGHGHMMHVLDSEGTLIALWKNA